MSQCRAQTISSASKRTEANTFTEVCMRMTTLCVQCLCSLSNKLTTRQKKRNYFYNNLILFTNLWFGAMEETDFKPHWSVNRTFKIFLPTIHMIVEQIFKLCAIHAWLDRINSKAVKDMPATCQSSLACRNKLAILSASSIF